jgi:predicted metal-binding protein
MEHDEINKTDEQIDPAIREDLQKLVGLAMEQGADNAVVIPCSDILIDPRVRFKCMIPKCYMSGACNHCPPHGYGIDEVRDMVSAYGWAVFFRVRVESSVIAAKGLADWIHAGQLDDRGIILSLGASYLSVFAIVSNIRKAAEEMGYSPTRGFAAGNCRDVLCHEEPVCRMLTREQTCRNAEISNPSLESCGMDAFTMAARAGWDVYPIGGTCEPDSVSRGSLMGLVLVV